MPEATVLYSVTGVVVVGLIAWVSMVLAKAKEPWSRPAPPEEPAAEQDAPEETKEEAAADSEAAPEPKVDGDAPKLDVNDTARATPVALSEGRQKAASESRETEDEEEKKAEA